MPLSPARPRRKLHTRAIECRGYERDDGLWDLEGRLTDARAYPYRNAWRGTVPPGGFLHEMHVRLTLDDRLTVVAIELATDNGPHATCGAILGNFQRLVGERMGPGWNKRVRSLVGGVEGCAHHVELLCMMATVAFQTVGPALALRPEGVAIEGGAGFLVNSCHLWRDGDTLEQELRQDPLQALAGDSEPG